MLAKIAIPPVLAVLLLSLAASAEFVGLDANGDQMCGPEDMLFQAGPADVGTTKTIDVFFDDLPPLLGFACTFCATDKEKIGSWTWTYSPLPPSWQLIPAVESDDPAFPIEVSAFIPERYPDYTCWIIYGTDFSFMNLIEEFPFSAGTFEFEVAEEGCIQWLLDVEGGNTAAQGISFSTILFDAPGEACDTVSCPGVTSAESESWGSVKRLFR